MKSIRELRQLLPFKYEEINSLLHILARRKIDMDVWLPTKGINLQRELVWDLDQKRELIWSILMNRKIPRLAIMNIIPCIEIDIDGIYQIIDGKQRLSTMIDFYKNKFTLKTDDGDLYFNELPIDYQRVIKGYAIPIYIAYEQYGNQFTDDDKIKWFKLINFAGTPMDKKHFEKLT